MIRSPRVRCIAIAAALALAALSVAGCDSGSPGAPPSAAAPSSPLPAGGQYELVDSLCEHVNLDRLTAILPAVTEPPGDDNLATIRSCVATLGPSDDEDEQGFVGVSLEVYDDEAAARGAYDQFYNTNLGMSEGTTEVGGIGQKAFRALSPAFDGMLLVRVLDGNANIATSWLYPVDQGDLPGQDAIFEALLEITRATMASLQDA